MSQIKSSMPSRWQHHPQAELKPTAFAFGRLGFGRFGLHGRIIRERGQPEQGNPNRSPRPDAGRLGI